ncbi:RHS repeat-associated core domain-containing protein [Argonema antarcticum]|uniref:RHS repeat-associated core domain-containing protein n=1 Tax=Argonema antarcticum TaxID=2942763 RepID=UPI002010DBDD|nr:RHS repeat-associated core domain-containing protein [Argonema antarcticum]MCL1474218.1 RHS repeat-associated core domain-containing protein [Argonema antarcticum A004/B2]
MGNGNLISNYVYAGGSSPFMRLDGSGNPVYYLTDAMGSTIGLADGTGASAAKFNYDSFGNLRSSSGAAANTGVAGGDFRFQGQWLEQGTGIYNFRARDYDSKTGMFLSRDPVDPLQYEPESFNPYQFVYHNPHVYTDPTGEITISELNVSQVMSDIVRDIQSQTLRRGVRGALDRAQGVATDVFSSVLKTLAPFDTNFDSYGTLFGRPLGGNAFELIVQNVLCRVVGGAYGSILNNIWLEAGVDPSGNPRDNGYGCGSIDFNYSPSQNSGSYSRSSLYNHPDFIIKRNPPFDTDRLPPAYLIGDFKRSVTEIGKRENQWNAIMNYARSVINGGHQYVPVALYVTLRGEERQRQVERRKARALRQFVILQVVSIFDF